MKQSRFTSVVIMVVTFVYVLFQAGCSGSANTEKQATAIYQKAESLRKEGRMLQALREFSRLVDFSDTKAFKNAEAALLKEGISIKSPLDSWTLKRMMEVQNRLVEQGKDWHRDGDITVPYSVTDAWGRSLMVAYSTGPKYSFYVFSAGADKQFNTDDDLKIYNRRKAIARDKNSSVTKKNSAVVHTRTRYPSTDRSHPAKNKESIIQLEEFITNNEG